MPPYDTARNDRIKVIDIDGTICENINNEDWTKMPVADPFWGNIAEIRKWHVNGDFICFWTARPENLRGITEQYLIRYNIPYHLLVMDKPRASEHGEYMFIDNKKVRGVTLKGTQFTKLVERDKTILVFEND